MLLEKMLEKMKKLLEQGGNIGDLKIGALYALGNQLEAIFYFIGHELGSMMEEKFANEDILLVLEEITEKYHLGIFHLKEKNGDHITFGLENCRSCRDIESGPIEIPQGFCSFEAGLYAGIVERLTGKHCFAQELECSLQSNVEMCSFMIVLPSE